MSFTYCFPIITHSVIHSVTHSLVTVSQLSLELNNKTFVNTIYYTICLSFWYIYSFSIVFHCFVVNYYVNFFFDFQNTYMIIIHNKPENIYQCHNSKILKKVCLMYDLFYSIFSYVYCTYYICMLYNAPMNAL